MQSGSHRVEMNLRTGIYAACAPLSGFPSLEVFGRRDWIEMKPGVRKFFRLCGYTPASCLSSWNLRSNHSFWPEASIEDSREGAWQTLFSR